MRDENYKKRLVEYFRKNLSKGYPADTLKWALIKQGNSRSAVELAMDEAQKEIAETVPKFEPKVEYLNVEDIKAQEQEQPKKSWWKRLFWG